MKHIHFIAMGGAIMHQLALALLSQGYTITGSDDEINDPARTNLGKAGILPDRDGWFPERITSDLDAIVLGMHAKSNNPELIRAKELNIPIYSFPQYVYEVSKEKKRVVVAGSHGKTTITSMIMHILREQNMDFDYLVGAKVAGFEQSVQLTDAPLIILEGDEYPASAEEKRPKIFFYHPHISVLSGIAWDHINVFPTYENYCSQFLQYLSGMEHGATLVYNNEDSEVIRIAGEAGTHLQKIPYDTPPFHYEHGTAILDIPGHSQPLAVFGRHNLLNMQAAVKVCTELGIPEADCYNSIASFTGAAKRLEKMKETKQLAIYRDFAHAPSKLQATLTAVREAYPERTLIACFELHTYSSLNEQFLSQYAHSMDAADNAIVYFSQHALELKGLPPLDTNEVKKHFENEHLQVISDKEALQQQVKSLLTHSSSPVCLLLMSSGTFDGIDWNDVSSQ